MLHKAIFFDRDGTVIHDVGYLSRLEDISFIHEVVNFMRFCQDQGYLIFLITNQSGIARGFFDELFVQETNKKIETLLLDLGVIIQKSYYCPHHPTEATNPIYLQDCSCRKPNPGMLLQAAKDFSIDLKASFMIGDKPIDLEAGERAGCSSFNVSKILTLPTEKFSSLLKSK